VFRNRAHQLTEAAARELRDDSRRRHMLDLAHLSTHGGRISAAITARSVDRDLRSKTPSVQRDLARTSAKPVTPLAQSPNCLTGRDKTYGFIRS
jgi:hypothetical protein